MRYSHASLVAIAAVATFAGAAMGARADDPTPAASSAPPLTVAASTSLTTLAKAAAERFDREYPGAPVVVVSTGSRASLHALGGGMLDVALTDVASTDAAQIEHRIAVLPFAIVVDPATHVTNVTREQLREILNGKLANWKDAGGADLPIRVISRGVHSGVWQLVQRKVLGGSPAAAAAIVVEATGIALETLARTPGGLTVVALAPARASHGTVVSLDGAPPDDAHIADGTYDLWAYEWAVTEGAPTTHASRFLAVLEGDRALLKSLGFFSVRDLGPGALAP